MTENNGTNNSAWSKEMKESAEMNLRDHLMHQVSQMIPREAASGISAEEVAYAGAHADARATADAEIVYAANADAQTAADHKN